MPFFDNNSIIIFYLLNLFNKLHYYLNKSKINGYSDWVIPSIAQLKTLNIYIRNFIFTPSQSYLFQEPSDNENIISEPSRSGIFLLMGQDGDNLQNYYRCPKSSDKCQYDKNITYHPFKGLECNPENASIGTILIRNVK